MKTDEFCWKLFQEDWNVKNQKETVDDYIVIVGTQKLKQNWSAM